jgi:replicative DNA helicase
MRLLKASQDIRELALNKTLRVADIVDGSDKALYEATNKTVSTDTDATSIAARYYNRVENALVNGVKSGISYGFDALDNRMGGLMPGGVSVLAAPAGAGKTSLVLSLIRQLATCQKRVALYSLEMTDEQIIRSLIAMEGKLDRVNLMQFKLSRQDWSEFVRASGLVSGYPLYIIDDYTSLSPEQLRLSLRKLTSGGSALDAIVIDGLWLMHPSISTGERRTDVKLIIEKLVSVSRDFNTPILLVHQLSRAPGDRNDKRPMLSDLSESISVSQTAEIVLGLYRPTYYDRNHVDSNTYLTVLKARHIPNADSLTFVLEFDASRGAYTAARDV